MKKAYLVSCFNYYDNRIKYWEKYLNNNDYEIEYITSNFDHISKKQIKIDRDNVIQIKTLKYSKNISIKRILSHLLFSLRVYKYLKRKDKDFVYVMIPPNFLLYFLSKLKKTNQFKLVADIFDVWPETFPIKDKPFMKLPFYLWKKIRTISFHNVDFVITECDLYQEVLLEELNHVPKKTLYLTKDFKVKQTKILRNKKNIELCYLGSINNIIDIDLIISLLKKINLERKVSLNIIGDGENREIFLRELDREKISYKFHGKLFLDEDKYKILYNCDFGLNIMKNEVTVGLTMKSMDYFASYLPIINNINGDTKNLVRKYDAGFNIDSETLDIVAERIVNISELEIDSMKKRVKKMHERLFSYSSFMENVDDIFKKIEEVGK
ncbi:glycosyltransferase [Vagococcus fluvialis]|uniref:glycosyltransferase n=1 Tax=Vagococcus fluvialis TaxID=2738 RepID=UPI0037A46E52